MGDHSRHLPSTTKEACPGAKSEVHRLIEPVAGGPVTMDRSACDRIRNGLSSKVLDGNRGCFCGAVRPSVDPRTQEARHLLQPYL